MKSNNEFPKEQCLNIMDKLTNFSISKMFLQPVDPERDNIPNYFSIVKNPMDLSTVRQKLQEDKYSTVQEWKNDIDTIWDNSLLVNSPNSVLGCITLEMQMQWRNLSSEISDDPDADWLNKLYKLRDSLSNFPKRKNKQNLFSSNNTKNKVKSKAPKANKQPQQKPAVKKNFTRAEICKLSSDINQYVKDAFQIQSIFDILCRNEKNINFKDEFLELDLCTVQKTTLAMLREKVDQIIESKN